MDNTNTTRLSNQQQEQQQRAPPPPPPSAAANTNLLWAYQLRRENIHLLNELGVTKSDLNATNKALTNLAQDVSHIQQTTTELNAKVQTPANLANDVNNNLAELRHRVYVGDEEVRGRITALEAGHSLLGDVVEKVKEELMEGRVSADTISAGAGAAMGKYIENWWDTKGKEEIANLVKDEVQKQGSSSDQQAVQSETSHLNLDDTFKDTELVPDSMPTQLLPQPSGRRQRGNTPLALQTLSQSTLSSVTSDMTVSRRSPALTPHETFRDATLEHGASNQGGRSLIEYFAHAETARAELPPKKREGRIVENFVAGVADTGTRTVLEKELDDNGWMWSVLAGAVKRVTSANAPQKVGKKRKRRFISIVPADEEDLA